MTDATTRAAAEPLLRSMLPSLGALLVLTVIFWAPALFRQRSIFHGDFVVDGLPLFDLLARAIRGEADLLWSDEIYGGHALFAEGQGAFAHPVNLLLATLVTPVLGTVSAANLFLWWTMLFGGIGVAGLGRSLGASPWAACFGAVAVGFSGQWITELQNPIIAGTLAWAPWSLWAMEAWLRRPGPASAARLGSACALLLLAGYPQICHAVLLYMVMSLLAGLLQREQRRDWARRWAGLCASGAAAVLLGLGLAAIQVLPLLELAGLSHRQNGIALFPIPLEFSLRGFLSSDFSSPMPTQFAAVGSVLVCITASLFALVAAPPRARAHLPATVLLLLFGTQGAVFRLFYDHDLVPGLHSFRATFPYLAIGIIGIGVAAAFAIDGIARGAVAASGTGWHPGALVRHPVAWLLALLAGLWIGLLAALGIGPIAPIEWAAVSAAALVGPALVRARRPGLIPPMLALTLVAECLCLRTHCFPFAAPALFAEPASVAAIEALPDWREFKTYDDTISTGYTVRPPHAPGLQSNVRRFLANLGPLSTSLWDLPSFGGALALPLQRWAEAQPVIETEIHGRSTVTPGLRLIDLLGLRFVALGSPVATAGFRLFRPAEAEAGWIMENGAARPRFQLYARHVAVEGPEQALQALQGLDRPLLVIENPAAARRPEMSDPVENDPLPASFTVSEARSTLYRVMVSARVRTWFFLADAAHPGWRATIDGAETPVFPAQLMGKAVAIPAGEHELIIRFDSKSYRWGRAITLGATILFLGALFVEALRSPLAERLARRA